MRLNKIQYHLTQEIDLEVGALYKLHKDSNSKIK